MPFNRQDYRTRGGNVAVVICCPTLVSPHRLVYFDQNPQGSWVIRDFLTHLRLDNEASTLTVAEIERDAVYSEPPPWCNVEDAPRDWQLYLELRTTVYKGQRNRNVDTQPPVHQPQLWKRLL